MVDIIAMTACERLIEADNAYHDLLRGRQVRQVTDENGEQLTFTATNRTVLLAYIMQLQAQCPEYVAKASSMSATRPIRFLF